MNDALQAERRGAAQQGAARRRDEGAEGTERERKREREGSGRVEYSGSSKVRKREREREGCGCSPKTAVPQKGKKKRGAEERESPTESGSLEMVD